MRDNQIILICTEYVFIFVVTGEFVHVPITFRTFDTLRIQQIFRLAYDEQNSIKTMFKNVRR